MCGGDGELGRVDGCAEGGRRAGRDVWGVFGVRYVLAFFLEPSVAGWMGWGANGVNSGIYDG